MNIISSFSGSDDIYPFLSKECAANFTLYPNRFNDLTAFSILWGKIFALPADGAITPIVSPFDSFFGFINFIFLFLLINFSLTELLIFEGKNNF